MNKLAYTISAFSILVGFFFVGLITYWMIYPYEVLTFGEGNGITYEKTVKAGGYLKLRQVSCKKRNISSVVNRQFIDSIVYQVPTMNNDRPTGCSDKVEYIYIPKALPVGVYYINTVISFKVNPLRTMTYTVKTNEFTIVE